MRTRTMLTRRDFIMQSSLGLCSLAAPCIARPLLAAACPDERVSPEVLFYTKRENNVIQCGICPRQCTVPDGARGYCGNKQNTGGTYRCLVHSYPCEARTDPVERKPFFHYLPSSRAYSIGMAGCNFRCRFCHNWQIAQVLPEQVETIHLTPDMLVKRARTAGSASIAYTYTEPTIFYDYMLAGARAGKKRGLGNIMISNGYINPAPLKKLSRYLDAINVDLKSFSDTFYRTYCDAELGPVLATLQRLKDLEVWFEIITLVIPSLNDSPEEVNRMCAWIAKNIGRDVPLHFTRFFPGHTMTAVPATPIETLERCHTIAKRHGINYVYLGNVAHHPLLSTYCPGCAAMLIHRIGYDVVANHLSDGKCPACSMPIPGVWARG